uniref:Endoribonuclease n=1 Tax=Rhabditophanes sp. KR3021 TaxID=114890 RepID=A0AC35TG90_9BILA
MDKDAPTTTDITLDWGKKITPSHGGKGTGKPHVNETLFTTPIYQALINIYGGNVFKPEVCQPESLIETSKKVLIDQFFDLYTKSEMFQKVYLFLTQNKIVKEDGFYERLFTWWFGTYTRCHGPVGSSGFEHVFSGEHKNEIVDGHHSWVRYYLGQKAGLIEYHGYESRVANLTGTIQYKWQGHLKLIGGFLMQTSPLFDFSLYTLCSMLQIENGGCHFKIDEHPLSVTSFHEKCLDGVCLTTAYPSE